MYFMKIIYLKFLLDLEIQKITSFESSRKSMRSEAAHVFVTMPTKLQPIQLLLVCFYCVLLMGTLCSGPVCNFGTPTQMSTSEMREREGYAMRKKAPGSFKLSRSEQMLLGKIKSASEQRDWQAVCSLFETYPGKAVPIYTAAMNAAFRCRKYQEGASIYEKCEQVCENLDEPVFSAGLRLYGKLGEPEKVRKVWDAAMNKCKLDEVLAASRISAAADEGDVETAAVVLDLMQDKGVPIKKFHLASAIRACWGFGNKQHQAAKYFFQLSPKLGIEPNIVTFSTLAGAYFTAPLEEVLSIYSDMKELNVGANKVFAETFLTTLLQKKNTDIWPRRPDLLPNISRVKSHARIQAARVVLEDFEKAGVELSKLCSNIKQALKLMEEWTDGCSLVCSLFQQENDESSRVLEKSHESRKTHKWKGL